MTGLAAIVVVGAYMRKLYSHHDEYIPFQMICVFGSSICKIFNFLRDI